MEYKLKKDDKTYYYDVTYDDAKLREILANLESYSYTAICRESIVGGIANEITKWPASNTFIKNRVKSLIKSKSKSDICSLNVKVVDKNHVEYEYTYRKLPELYVFIDLLINNIHPFKYKSLFGVSLNQYFFIFSYDQRMLDGLLHYVYSDELKEDDLNKDYNYKGLLELYKQTLGCFKFNLCAIKESVDTKEEIDGLAIQKKL